MIIQSSEIQMIENCLFYLRSNYINIYSNVGDTALSSVNLNQFTPLYHNHFRYISCTFFFGEGKVHCRADDLSKISKHSNAFHGIDDCHCFRLVVLCSRRKSSRD